MTIANWSNAEVTAIRLRPGDDLKSSLISFASEQELEAAMIMTAVGSLSQVFLRLAGKKEWTHFQGKHEIVSLTGTLSRHGAHLHVSVSDSKGNTTGGHLVNGSVVHTTAEIVIAKLNSVIFRRELCLQSGFKELVIEALPVDSDGR